MAARRAAMGYGGCSLAMKTEAKSLIHCDVSCAHHSVRVPCHEAERHRAQAHAMPQSITRVTSLHGVGYVHGA